MVKLNKVYNSQRSDEEGNDIQAELREWGSPLADMSRAMPFTVPVNYFETSIDSLCRYASGTEDGTRVGPKSLPFTVPAGFFEALPQNMLHLVKTDDVVSTWPKNTPHSLPQGYFDEFPSAILAKANKPAGKVVNFAPRLWMRQAVAAILILAVGIGGYEYFNHKHAGPEKQLARVPQNSVKEYVHQNLSGVDVEPVVATPAASVAVADAIKQLDQSDIEQYLDETGLKTEYSIN